jgi:hypothetical protein
MRQLKTVGALLPALARAAGWGAVMELATLKAEWSNIMGKAVAIHCSPERLQRGRLTVVVDSSPWLTQLGFFKADMQAKVNTALGVERVSEVFLVVGRVEAKIASQPVPERPLSDAEIDAVEQSVADLEDENVRESLRHLMLSDLRRERRSP